MVESHSLKLPISYHYDLYIPENPKGLLLSLHGYSQDKGASMKFGRAASENWIVAALQAPYPHHRRLDGVFETGFGWVTSFMSDEAIKNHHRFLQTVTQSIYKRGLINAPKAVILGFSQSVSLNYRFAVAHPEYVAGIIAVAGAMPSSWGEPDSEPKPRLTVPILHIAPTEDEAYSAERLVAFKTQLKARCEALNWHEEPGGHRVPRKSYPVMKAWLKALA